VTGSVREVPWHDGVSTAALEWTWRPDVRDRWQQYRRRRVCLSPTTMHGQRYGISKCGSESSRSGGLVIGKPSAPLASFRARGRRHAQPLTGMIPVAFVPTARARQSTSDRSCRCDPLKWFAR
jgi:hypothetical protein